MRDAILRALESVAAEHGVRVLHAIESGSRAWGFASPNSDYDVRFLYLHELRWYLRIPAGRDTINRMLPGDLDLAGWDLHKALGLFARSNVALFEHLGSEIVYSECGDLAVRLRELIPQFFNPFAAGHHYLSLARNMATEHLDKPAVDIKKLFYVMRPLAAFRWIELHAAMPPTRFVDVLAGIDLTGAQRRQVDDLRAQKARLDEGDTIDLDPDIRCWLDGWLRRSGDAAPDLPQCRGDDELLNELFLRLVST